MSPLPSRALVATHGSGVGPAPVPSPSRTPLRKTTTDVSSSPGGIAEASMRNVKISGSATVATGAVITTALPRTENPAGAGTAADVTTIETLPPTGDVTVACTGVVEVAPP